MQGSNLQIVLYKISYRHVFFHLHPSCPDAILNDSSVVECVRWRVMLQWKNNRTKSIVRALLANTALSTTSKLNNWSWSSPYNLWIQQHNEAGQIQQSIRFKLNKKLSKLGYNAGLLYKNMYITRFHNANTIALSCNMPEFCNQ
jgi:hypothetical protein